LKDKEINIPIPKIKLPKIKFPKFSIPEKIKRKFGWIPSHERKDCIVNLKEFNLQLKCTQDEMDIIKSKYNYQVEAPTKNGYFYIKAYWDDNEIYKGIGKNYYSKYKLYDHQIEEFLGAIRRNLKKELAEKEYKQYDL